MKTGLRLAVTVTFGVGLVLHAQPAPPDLVIVNARVYTGLPNAPWAEALSIRGERILEVGTSDVIRKQAGAVTRIIDAGGKLVIPGINDAHAHVGGGPEYTALEGPPAFEQDPSLDEVIERIKAAVSKAPAGGWLKGEIGARVLDDPRATREVLDPITGDRPLLLASWHGHGALLNTAALRRLKVAEQEPDPAGGFFVRKTDGRTITGLAHEYADYIIRRRFNLLGPRDAQVKALREFATEAASFGITSVQIMSTSAPVADASAWISEAKVPLRVRLIDFPMTSMPSWKTPAARRTDALLTVSGTKWIIDGTPIERLMFIRDPYSDSPSLRGRLNFPEEDLRLFLQRALAAGEQPMFHAVGDAAIDTVLAALESTGGEKWAPLRPRLEHGDMLEPTHFDRAKRLGIVLVQNPAHFMIAPLMQDRLGERTARTDVVKTILGAGVPLALGSDGPMNPYLNMMFAAINPTNPGEALSIEQSLAAYTRGSAFAEFAERQKGTLAPEMLADIAMLSQDIFKAPPPELPKTTSLLTIVGGRIMHEGK
ncbi:MAG: amidohydrolase [Acidobacteriota bacterium]|nr:amidohydrolase [Acidobacteriota bacterium]MDQ3419956.1 amidohydrolase [Acidobacteriota bacterium]